MDPHWRHPYGLRPTLRHMMILVVHFALLSALARLLRSGVYGGLILVLALSPILLALLLLSALALFSGTIYAPLIYTLF